MIKNLIFDFGKVLVNHDLQPLLERHFGDDEVSLIGFHKILSDPEFINMCDRGIIPFEKMIDGAIKRYPEYSDAFTFFKDNYLEEITGEIEGMRVLLKKLKQSGFKLYGLTNWSDTIYRVMEKFDIFRLLDGMVISCEEHFIKPEKEIYLRLCVLACTSFSYVLLRLTSTDSGSYSAPISATMKRRFPILPGACFIRGMRLVPVFLKQRSLRLI